MQAIDSVPKVSYEELLSKYDTFFFDCDGVLWEELKPIKGAMGTLAELKNQNKNIFIVTNSSKSRKFIKEKVQKMLNFEMDEEQIYGTSYLVAQYLKGFSDSIKKVYAIGHSGLVDELKLAGFDVVWAQGHHGKTMNSEKFLNIQTDDDIGAVVCAFDPEINFYKLCYASICIQKGALFVATCDDPNVKNGRFKMPGGGSIVRSLAHSSEVEPYVVGKPKTFSIDHAIETYKLDKSKCLMTGDRLTTDIQLGINAGIDTCLVLTGITTEENFIESASNEEGPLPTYYADNLAYASE